MFMGWSMTSNMRTPLIIDAMAMARKHGRLAHDGVIFHSDQGFQYQHASWQKLLSDANMPQPMSFKGDSLLTG